METTVETITENLREIKSRGYIPSQRRGGTGVGHTLEQLLGLNENNFTVPDLGEVELKATRENANSLITLFTLDRNVWKTQQQDIILKHGLVEQERRNLYVTFSGFNSIRGLRTSISEDALLLTNTSNELLAQWKFESILAQFHKKVRHLILVNVKSRKEQNQEYFHYHQATFYSGWLLRWHIPKLFRNGTIVLDLRMHLKANTVRNHGSAFRIHESHLTQIYPYGEQLPI